MGLKIVYVKTGEKPAEKIVNNDLESLQQLCGGHIETVRLYNEGDFVYFAIVNEEGALIDLPVNRLLNGWALHGDLFITKTTLYGGDFLSLTEEEAQIFKQVFEAKAIFIS